MTVAKIYEVEGFRFESTPKGNPFKGMLIARFPEFEPHSAEVNLPSLRSRNDYAGEAAEVCGMDQKRLKRRRRRGHRPSAPRR